MSQVWTCQACGLNNVDVTYCEACGASGQPTSAPVQPAGNVTLDTIDCGECGAAVNIASSLGRGQVSCAFCGAVIDLNSPDYAIVSRCISNQFPPMSNITIGLEGNVGGKIYRVVGRLRYLSAEGWQWDEWFMVAEDGSQVFLEEDEREFTILEPFTPKQAPTMADLESAESVTIDGAQHFVGERSSAKIAYFEGQLPWQVTVDTEVTFADLAASSGVPVSVEWTKRELEFYRGRKVAVHAVAQAFGLMALYNAPAVAYEDYGAHYSSDTSGEMESGSQGVIFALLFFFLFVPLFAVDGCDDDDSYGGGSYSGGHYSSSGGFGK